MVVRDPAKYLSSLVAPRSGTTALYEYLSDHPLVVASKQKEPHYFSTDFKDFSWASNETEYLNLFPKGASRGNKGSPRSVATVSLFRSRNSRISLISILMRRLIILARSPAEMIPSWHAQVLYATDENIVRFRRGLARNR